MKVTLVNYTPDAVKTIESAASNCYNSKSSNNGVLLDSCYQSGHTSIMEFADFTFHIEGVSRSLLAQLTRHRMSSFAVRSQRYVSENDFSYVVPPSIRDNKEVMSQYVATMNKINWFYNWSKDKGIPSEDARYCLPNSCETILEYKTNLRSLVNFMNERLCTRAQWEIRGLAQAIRDCVLEKFPEFKPYLVPKCEKHPGFSFCTEKKSCGRHKKLEEVYKNE